MYKVFDTATPTRAHDITPAPQDRRPRVAVVGSGISGLGAAHELRGHAHVTLFEAGSRYGGHTHTVDVTLGGVTHGVDTGFLVLNERTYPRLLALFAQLDVPVAKSDMSFSVQAPLGPRRARLEWSGTSIASVFSQRANLLRPRFWRMLRELMRFNALATRMAEAQAPTGADATSLGSLGEFLDAQRFSREFREWYLLPMLGCIWSCPVDQMLAFPLVTLLRFCHNHGLLQAADRPQWYTVAGGARQYVDRVVAGIDEARLGCPVTEVRREGGVVRIHSRRGWERFDAIVFASHPDETLALLADANAREREVLGAIRYQPNRAVLHTDVSQLPSRQQAWAAWNYESAGDGSQRVCLHYLINRLQPLPWAQPVIVSLNPLRPIARSAVIGEYDYAHPVFDAAALLAQQAVGELQGHRGSWFAGAWTGYGFHEDGLASGQAAARSVLASVHVSHQERAAP